MPEPRQSETACRPGEDSAGATASRLSEAVVFLRHAARKGAEKLSAVIRRPADRGRPKAPALPRKH